MLKDAKKIPGLFPWNPLGARDPSYVNSLHAVLRATLRLEPASLQSANCTPKTKSLLRPWLITPQTSHKTNVKVFKNYLKQFKDLEFTNDAVRHSSPYFQLGSVHKWRHLKFEVFRPPPLRWRHFFPKMILGKIVFMVKLKIQDLAMNIIAKQKSFRLLLAECFRYRNKITLHFN